MDAQNTRRGEEPTVVHGQERPEGIGFPHIVPEWVPENRRTTNAPPKRTPCPMGTVERAAMREDGMSAAEKNAARSIDWEGGERGHDTLVCVRDGGTRQGHRHRPRTAARRYAARSRLSASRIRAKTDKIEAVRITNEIANAVKEQTGRSITRERENGQGKTGVEAAAAALGTGRHRAQENPAALAARWRPSPAARTGERGERSAARPGRER